MTARRMIWTTALMAIAATALGGVEYGIAANYTRDAGIASHSSVLFAEDFEEASIGTMTGRWDNVREADNMAFSADRPMETGGSQSLYISGLEDMGYANADLYTRLPNYAVGHRRVYARYYSKFATDCGAVHHYVWLQGQPNPPGWPSMFAGLPSPDQNKFSSGVEPMSHAWHWDMYTYWSEMGCTSACWGNEFNPSPEVPVVRGDWTCVEFMLKVNDPPSSHNGELQFWIDGVEVMHLGEGFPNYRQQGDSWYPEGGTGFPGFQWRTAAVPMINIFWFQFDVAEGYGDPSCRGWYDDVVVATNYIGPISVEPDTTPPTVQIETPSASGSHTTYLPSITVAGTATDDRGIMSFAWENDRGGSGSGTPGTSWSCGGISLELGDNVITVTVTDPGDNTDSDTITITRLEDTEAPTVSIQVPTGDAVYSTYDSSITLSGTASDNANIALVAVENSIGWIGTAIGRDSWSHANVPLIVGVNVITVRATDTAGLPGEDVITITRLSGSGPPVISITEPTGDATCTTNAESISLAGIAADNTSVVEVTWASSGGDGGSAQGTAAWSVAGIPLYDGENVITVTARDTEGFTGSDAITVLRSDGPQPPDDEDPFLDAIEQAVAASEGGVYGFALPQDEAPRLYFATEGEPVDEATVRLFSPLGERVAEWEGSVVTDLGNGICAVELGSLAVGTGVYIAEIVAGDRTTTGPILLVR